MNSLGPADNVLLQMFRTAHAVRDLVAQAVDGTGLTPDEWAVLSTIGYHGRISPSELASGLRVPPTTISRHVAGFVESGRAARVPNPDDGRSYLLELTPDGKAVVATVVPRFRDTLHRLGEQVSLDEIEAALLELERAARAVAF
jgi:DNA-binding MarR family transcriptional regulator